MYMYACAAHRWYLWLFIAFWGTLGGLQAGVAFSATLNIPADYPSIQAGINAALDGDLVLIAPGTYRENLHVDGKWVTLASLFYTTGQYEYIAETIIDGGGRKTIKIGPQADGTEINGLRIRNGDDGIEIQSRAFVLNNRIVDNSDGIDYEGGGGLCNHNLIACNRDDGVDLDGAAGVEITNNTIQDNKDDGIEIRLHAYSGPTLNINIIANSIVDNGEDGIQLIDYPDLSDRVFRIERNLFIGNDMAAVGLMGNGNTVENYEGAAIPERVYLINNTFVRNSYGVTGGANLIALNNIFTHTHRIALKRVGNDSIAAFNLFWDNGIHYQDSNVDLAESLFDDPLLDSAYRLMLNSPALNSGAVFFEWQGETVLDLPATSYSGAAPELGAREYVPPPDTDTATIGFDFPAEATCQKEDDKPECFITSIAYGSFVGPHLGTLRAFRDRFLLPNRVGRAFVDGYYSASPRWIAWVEDHRWLQAVLRPVILVMIIVSYLILNLKLVYVLVFAAIAAATRAIARTEKSLPA